VRAVVFCKQTNGEQQKKSDFLGALRKSTLPKDYIKFSKTVSSKTFAAGLYSFKRHFVWIKKDLIKADRKD